MPKNPGKRFEEDFSKSLNCFFLRLKDAAGWGTSANIRFTSSNICDFIIYAGGGTIFLAELKSTDKASKAYTDREHVQLNNLLKEKNPYVYKCHIINFRKFHKTYILSAECVFRCLQTRSSVPSDYCADHGLLIPQEIKKVRFKYFIENVLKEIDNAGF